MLGHYQAGLKVRPQQVNRRGWGGAVLAVVAEASAAGAAQLVHEAGGLVAARGQGGVGEAVLHIVHQVVGAGDLRPKNRGLFQKGVGKYL